VNRSDAVAPLLHVRSARRQFGGLVAVDVHDISVAPNSITSLIGPNGAGKSTLFNVISGFDRGGKGEWAFEGKDISNRPPHELADLGIIRTFQAARPIVTLSLMENLLLSAQDQTGEHWMRAMFSRPSWRRREAENADRARELLARLKLEALADSPAGELSGGQGKLLDLGRALMCRPRLLMLDEPMAGVNPRLAESLIEHILWTRSEGATVLFVEHNMDVVAEISDHVVCMAAGKVLVSGTPQEVMRAPEVMEAYLGSDAEPDEAAVWHE
jgi:neutral amino acid transport system ATP-binding protein